MIKQINKIILFLLLLTFIASCNTSKKAGVQEELAFRKYLNTRDIDIKKT